MRQFVLSLALAVVLAAAFYPTRADAWALRIGGLTTFNTGPDSAAARVLGGTKFAIGVDNDMRLFRYLAFNTSTLFSVDGDSMFIDGYLGLKVLIPVALEGKLEVGIRGNFLLKAFYPFEDAFSSALGIGGVTGPSIIWNTGVLRLSFDVDIQIFNLVYPGSYKHLDTQVAVTYLVGLGF